MVIIKLENVSKKYQIYHEDQRISDTLREAAMKQLRSFFDRISNRNKISEQTLEEFWALQDLNFEIKEGDRVGVIGRNGAGKSTLLKILSRIIEPSSGRISIRGRIASLLEVGTGFHPDLTGRENIFLNGAILGMSRREIIRNFDAIVAFAEVEKFLDTPVKRFSSGMYTRLGFAVAAYLDTDVLIVDEVLAVGDTQFQEKCLKKMNEMGSSGRTILFVSHNVGAILALCNRGIFLENGRIKVSGPIDECVNQYVSSCPIASSVWKGSVGNEHVEIISASLNSVEKGRDYFYQGEETTLELEYEVLKAQKELFLGIEIWNMKNHLLARSRLTDHEKHGHVCMIPGKYKVFFHLDVGLFHEGEYIVKVDYGVGNQKHVTATEIALKFPVYSKNDHSMYRPYLEREGISLGNRWSVDRCIPVRRNNA